MAGKHTTPRITQGAPEPSEDTPLPEEADEDESPETASESTPLDVLRTHLQQIQDAVNKITADLAPTRLPARPQTRSPSPPVATRELIFPEPPTFDGKVSEFDTFIAACDLYFEVRDQTFAKDSIKVLFVINRLRGGPAEWAMAVRRHDAENPILSDYAEFKQELTTMYSDRNAFAKAERKIATLEQTKSASTYAAQFQTLASILGLDKNAKMTYFRRGLSTTVKTALSLVHPAPATFKVLVDRAVAIDQAIYEAEKESRQLSQALWALQPLPRQPQKRPFPYDMAPETVRPDKVTLRSGPRPPLTAEERQRRFEQGLCAYCGDGTHRTRECHRRPMQPSGPAKPPVAPHPSSHRQAPPFPPPQLPHPSTAYMESSHLRPVPNAQPVPRANLSGNPEPQCPVRQEY